MYAAMWARTFDLKDWLGSRRSAHRDLFCPSMSVAIVNVFNNHTTRFFFTPMVFAPPACRLFCSSCHAFKSK